MKAQEGEAVHRRVSEVESETESGHDGPVEGAGGDQGGRRGVPPWARIDAIRARASGSEVVMEDGEREPETA